MEIAPHSGARPGLCLTVVVSASTWFGDAVRDLLDPRLRGRLGRYGAGRDASPDPERDVRAERLGLFVIRATGSSASITNREEFTPRTFGHQSTAPSRQ